jgi:RND superfamily putative drug exporter
MERDFDAYAVKSIDALLMHKPDGNIEPNMPIMPFALIFGPPMDYEVFRVSRMREQYDQPGNSTQAAATGLDTIGRPVVSTAALMRLLLAAIGTSGAPPIKLFGIGMVFAVLTDAHPAQERPSRNCRPGRPGGLRARFYDRLDIKETDVSAETDERAPVACGLKPASGVPVT